MSIGFSAIMWVNNNFSLPLFEKEGLGEILLIILYHQRFSNPPTCLSAGRYTPFSKGGINKTFRYHSDVTNTFHDDPGLFALSQEAEL
jgi:hypothetical protein